MQKDESTYLGRPSSLETRHRADPGRYDGRMAYRRCGRSGLSLPVLTLGLWQHFGDETAFGSARSLLLKAFDAGITHKLNDQWQLGLDSYYKIDRNLLDEGQFGQALVFTPFNYRFGRIYGAEATASYTTEKLTGYGNLALSRAMGKDIISGQNTFSQDELDYIATHMVHLDHDQTFTGSVGASYQVLEDTKVSIDGIYGSGLRSGFANTGHLPFYQQYNLGLTQHLPVDDKGVDVRFAVVNLLDSKYELRDGTGIGVGAPQWGPRLGLFMGLSRKF